MLIKFVLISVSSNYYLIVWRYPLKSGAFYSTLTCASVFVSSIVSIFIIVFCAQKKCFSLLCDTLDLDYIPLLFYAVSPQHTATTSKISHQHHTFVDDIFSVSFFLQNFFCYCLNSIVLAGYFIFRTKNNVDSMQKDRFSRICWNSTVFHLISVDFSL